MAGAAPMGAQQKAHWNVGSWYKLHGETVVKQVKRGTERLSPAGNRGSGDCSKAKEGIPESKEELP